MPRSSARFAEWKDPFRNDPFFRSRFYRYEKRFAKKDPKNDPKRDWKVFSQISKVVHRPKLAQKKRVFFTARLCRGSHGPDFGESLCVTLCPRFSMGRLVKLHGIPIESLRDWAWSASTGWFLGPSGPSSRWRCWIVQACKAGETCWDATIHPKSHYIMPPHFGQLVADHIPSPPERHYWN